jgi:hypothetical protein
MPLVVDSLRSTVSIATIASRSIPGKLVGVVGHFVIGVFAGGWGWDPNGNVTQNKGGGKCA